VETYRGIFKPGSSGFSGLLLLAGTAFSNLIRVKLSTWERGCPSILFFFYHGRTPRYTMVLISFFIEWTKITSEDICHPEKKKKITECLDKGIPSLSRPVKRTWLM
jgi:hypothetical protein